MSFFSAPETWVLVSFLLFMGLLVYLKVPGMLVKALDSRAEGIANELEEARKLREEAQQLLASYQRKQRDAMKEAEAIIAQAEEEATRLAEETRKNMQAQMERRTQLAEDKIAQAEAQAIQEVKSVATETAVRAASDLLRDKTSGPLGDRLLDNAVSEVSSRLH